MIVFNLTLSILSNISLVRSMQRLAAYPTNPADTYWTFF